jgi:hypothetical protein
MADDGTGLQDLRALDRDVARGVALLGEWRRALTKDPAGRADEEPLEPVRRVCGQSTWAALGGLHVSTVDQPLCDALRQWVYYLLQARVGRIDDVAWERAAAETVEVDLGEVRSRAGWRGAWRGAVAAPTAAAVRPWLAAGAELGPRLALVNSRRAARRVEVASRLGLAHPAAPLVGVPYAVLRETASQVLACTDELARAVLRDALRDDGGLAAVIVAVVARDAGEGWPSRLGAAWLRDLLRPAFAGGPLVLPALPPARGASSFARALAALGFAVRAARSSTAVPFALAHEPAFFAAHRLGFAVGALATDPVFYRRGLGLGARVAAAQSRALARTALFEARLDAMRILLGDDAAPAPRDLFEELTARSFGRSLDARLCGAWPAAREDEPARWLGLLDSVRLRGALRDRFDVDWFRNPRAWEDLRSTPLAREATDPARARAGVTEVIRAFEEALG